MRRNLKSVAQLLAGLAITLGLVSMKIFPRRLFFAFARWVADLGYYLFYRFRTRSIRNLSLALGAELDAPHIAAAVHRSLRSFFRAFVEVGLAINVPAEKIRAEIPLSGREHLEAALGKGNGAIALSAHLGNFFLVGTRLAAEGFSNSVLVNQAPDEYLGRFMDRCRVRLGHGTIHARPRRLAFRNLVETLRRNETTIVIADEYRSGDGVFVPFFGRTVVARRGPATLALRTGAALVPVCLVRGAEGELRLVIEPEIEVARTGDIKADVRENTRRIAEWVEKTVRAFPDQWNWTNVRWHQAPLGAELEKQPRYQGSTRTPAVTQFSSTKRTERGTS
jgi:Kdo2-lipid IVA lauroyltransferase/acyltransferase